MSELQRLAVVANDVISRARNMPRPSTSSNVHNRHRIDAERASSSTTRPNSAVGDVPSEAPGKFTLVMTLSRLCTLTIRICR